MIHSISIHMYRYCIIYRCGVCFVLTVLLRMEEHVDEASGEFQLHATESDESL